MGFYPLPTLGFHNTCRIYYFFGSEAITLPTMDYDYECDFPKRRWGSHREPFTNYM